MKIEFSNDFSAEVLNVINYIDNIHTNEAGLRWYIKFKEFLNESLKFPLTYSNSINNVFNELGLKCLFYNDWTIGFRIHSNAVQLIALIHKSNIVD